MILPLFSMNRKWIFLFFTVFISGITFTQAQSNFINGTIIMVTGETLSVKIKPARPDKLAKGISVYNDTTEEYTKLTYKNITYFKYDDREYFAKPTDDKPVFMERIIDGPAQLYTYTYKEKRGSKDIEVVDYYVEKKDDGRFKLMTKKTFKTEMSSFFSDNETLKEKIDNGYYTFDEKEATVEEYNDWVAQGKPGKKWKKEDGNYTHNSEDESKTDKNKRDNNNRNTNNSSTIYDGSKFAIDIPIMANYTLINSDNLVTQYGIRNYSGGFGYYAGLGVRWQLGRSFFWRNGVNVRMKRYHSNYLLDDGTPILKTCDEYGDLHYIGMYTMMHMELGNFILGGGFDIGFGSIYRARYSIKDNTGAEVYSGNLNNESIIAWDTLTNRNNFKAQVDLTMVLGYKIRLAKGACNLKPVFTYSIPLVSMFDVNLPTGGIPSFYSGTGVHGFNLSLGLIIDIGFPKAEKPRSLLDD